MKETTTSNKKQFIVLSSDEQLEHFFNGVYSLMNFYDISFKEDLYRDFKKVCYSLRATYTRLNSHESRNEWKDAFKRHKSMVANLTTEVVSMGKIDGISNPVVKVMRSKIVFSNGMSLEEVNIQPRSFWKAYRLFQYAVSTSDSNELVFLMRIINTVFSLCKDFALSPEEMDEDILTQVSEIENTCLSENADPIWGQRIEETLQLITKVAFESSYSSGFREIDLYGRAVARAVSGFDRRLKVEDLKLTSASTGASLNGITIPGMLASVFERIDDDYDYSEFDKIVGYDPPDPVEPIQKMKFSRNNCVAIESKKDSMRLIHTLCNQHHDRLTIFENMIKQIFKNYYHDCTFEQSRGRDFILNWMRDPSVDAIYSLDLHACSNTLSREWQRRIMQYTLAWYGFSLEENKVLIEVWSRIMSFDTSVRLPHSKKVVKFRFKTGQAMGYTNSFNSFANLHHIAYLTVIRYCKAKSKGYGIVGDDFTNAMSGDKDMEFVRLYKECMAFLNCECNENKGYIYNRNIPGRQTKIAEFCKYLVCDGVDITPYPLGLLTQSDKLMGKLSLLGWELSHIKMKIPFEKLILAMNCDQEAIIALDLLRKLPFNNLLNSVKGPFGMKKVYELDQAPIILAASISYVKQSVLLTALIEKNRDPDYIPKYSDLDNSIYGYRLKKEFKRIKKIASYDTIRRQKFLNWINNLETLALAQGLAVDNILRGILPEMDILEILPSLKIMEERDIERLISLSKFFESFVYNEDKDGVKLNWTNALDQETVLAQLEAIERLKMFDVNSTNHRFGTTSDRANIGFDYSKFVNDTRETLCFLFENDQEMWVSYINSLEFNADDVPELDKFWLSDMLTLDEEDFYLDEEEETNPWDDL